MVTNDGTGTEAKQIMNTMGEKAGFDCLEFNIRHYPCSTTRAIRVARYGINHEHQAQHGKGERIHR
jgi:hypothetical protein